MQTFGLFALRAWALWCSVGQGEIVPTEGGGETTQWSINWLAFQTALMVSHDLTQDDPAAELYDAMTIIRSELMRPMGEILQEEKARIAGDDLSVDG